MKLHDLYQLLSTEERLELAKRAGTDPGYLWQISTRWRGKKPSLVLLKKLADADSRLILGDLVQEFCDEPAKPPVREVA